MTPTDLDLLRDYAEKHSESAFAALVQRHLNLVYSAALRQVRSPQLAEEVAQSAFADLARNAGKLKPGTLLTAWLYEVARRTAIDVIRREARRQLREQIATEMNAANATASDWTHIEPLLDDAMHALDGIDRAAVLLRYFENKSLREVGVALGTSDDAAQKRVTRAVERLREYFAKHGVTTGAAGLAVVLSANAVQAAPVGLAVTISIAAVLAGTTLTTAITSTAVKTIAMTTLQKTLIAATLTATVGMGIYEAHQVSTARTLIQDLHQQQTAVAAQFEQLTQERDDANRRNAALRDDNDRLKLDTAELLKLRSAARMLRIENQKLDQVGNSGAITPQAETLARGFGMLGEYLTLERISDAGTNTAEALLETFLWALRENKFDRLQQIDAPVGGHYQQGDVVGEMPESERSIFEMLQNVLTNSAGFRLNSKLSADGQKYDVRLDADPLEGRTSKDFMKLKDFNMSFGLEHKANGWSFCDPTESAVTK